MEPKAHGSLQQGEEFCLIPRKDTLALGALPRHNVKRNTTMSSKRVTIPKGSGLLLLLGAMPQVGF